MPTEAKRETVARLRDELSRHPTLIVSEYRGLSVKDIAEIRRALRRQDIRYRVVKNRLLRIAAEGAVGEALAPLLSGPTAVAFGSDQGETARAVIEAVRPFSRIVRITGGVLGDRRIGPEGVQQLAALPSREVLLAQVAGGFAAPLAAVAGLVSAPLREVAGLFQALEERKASAAG